MAHDGFGIDGVEGVLSEAGIEATGFDVLADGINLMVAVSTPGDRYLLRRPNKLRDTDLFNDLEREYRLLKRLEATEIPAPEPVAFRGGEDPVLVTTYLKGETVPLGSGLPEGFRTPEGRRAVARDLIDVLADVHRLETEPFEDVCERQTPRTQVEHATTRLDRATAVTGREFADLRTVGDRLRETAPDERETTLVHGDFRPGNVLLDDRRGITGVIDWETAMLGDPRTELGYLLLRWRDDGDPVPSLDGIDTRYPDSEAVRDLRESNEAGLAPFTGREGSPDRSELIARYEERTGIAVENDRYYRAHAAFMLAAVWADLHRYRVEAGEDSDREPYIEYMTRVAEGIAGDGRGGRDG
ncbi:phosphotransferase family protein [Saliphagus infecundisoli]|uniref:Phosphotransferase family protein n=1 Tax=Saliphagus infecundisoli TaxID=1849069 RepID=A0ABD5QHB8_9EURY|nr:phosphotransferase family protein [Saliphagus infecundisoli]